MFQFIADAWPIFLGLFVLAVCSIAWLVITDKEHPPPPEDKTEKRATRPEGEPMTPVTTALAREHRRDPRRQIGDPTATMRLNRSRRATPKPEPDPEPEEEFPSPEAFAATAEAEDYTALTDAVFEPDVDRRELDILREENARLREELMVIRDEARVCQTVLADTTEALRGAEQRLALGNIDPLIHALEQNSGPMSREQLTSRAGFVAGSAEFGARLLDGIRWGYVRSYRTETGQTLYYLKGQALSTADAPDDAVALAAEEIAALAEVSP